MQNGYTIPKGLIVISRPSKASPCLTCKHSRRGKNIDPNGILGGPCDNCQPLEDYRAFIEGREPVDLVAARAAELEELRRIWPRDSRQGGGYCHKKKYTHLCPYCRKEFKSARKKRSCCDEFPCIQAHHREHERRSREKRRNAITGPKAPHGAKQDIRQLSL